MILYYDGCDHYNSSDAYYEVKKEHCSNIDTANIKEIKTRVHDRYVSHVGDYRTWSLVAITNDRKDVLLMEVDMDPYRNGYNHDHTDIMERGKEMITEAINEGAEEFVLDFSSILKSLGQQEIWCSWIEMAGSSHETTLSQNDNGPEPWGVFETIENMIKDAWFMLTWNPKNK